MHSNLGIIGVFAAGLLSFASPCVLPLLPIYVSLLTAQNSESNKINSLGNVVAFCAGFTLIFVALGAAASSVGAVLLNNQTILRKVGAIFVILSGFYLLGFIKINFLQREYRPLLEKTFNGKFGSFFMGIAFGAGWTPCIGPVLMAVVALASQSATIGHGAFLLFIYSLGIAAPLLAFAMFFDKIGNRINILYKYLPIVQKIGGALMVLIGIILYFDWLSKIVSFLM
jgi:cytochrome c-type biogenesis protein